MSMPEDLHRELDRTEKWCEASETAMRRMDAKDFDRSDLREALLQCPAHRWDSLQSAIALRDWLQVGKLMEDVLYEFLTDREAERD